MEQKRKAKAIMIQGTMSNAGKSLIAVGLCRILRQEGYRVAPFKSQNMALNSFITDEGLEMGRAQVVQAEAAGIKPSVLMNPILLKPTTDVGSQVIINGKVKSNMTAREYYKHKKELIPVVKEAYDKLASEYDVIVIEGAGSPAEINLREDDIVNMGMAELADAPVILVGDIDRGGVFAQLYGTIALLTEPEQERIQGLIINKFRGDKTILDPGLDILKERTGKDVLGVVPYMDIAIDDEDSLSERLDARRYIGTTYKNKGSIPDDLAGSGKAFIDIAVIRLPRISNFTDFTALSIEPGVSLRYVSDVRDLGKPDVIIIPGTKSTIRDMEWLRATGLEAKIMQKHHAGTLIIGVCGGYQMLGDRISDNVGAETLITSHYAGYQGTEAQGLGFLPMVTEFSEEKILDRVTFELQGLSGEFKTLNGKKVTGYEIHMGETYINSHPSRTPGEMVRNETEEKITEENKCICTSRDNVLGTYIHGFFDEDDLRKAFLDMLYKRKGIDPDNITELRYEDFKEEQYDKLAAVLRDSLDMEKIKKMIFR